MYCLDKVVLNFDILNTGSWYWFNTDFAPIFVFEQLTCKICLCCEFLDNLGEIGFDCHILRQIYLFDSQPRSKHFVSVNLFNLYDRKIVI